MKTLLPIVVSLLVFQYTHAQNNNPVYDSSLVKKLGADDYGMKNYVLVILKAGTNDTKDKSFVSNAFKGHLANIGRLAEKGRLIIAGPIGENNNGYRGIFVLNTPNLEEAKEMLQTDPAIKKNLLSVDLYPWYGSAALAAYLPEAEKIWKIKP